ncbi:hypothetical protein M0D69_18720 [Caballeronia sp. SEWSISQ10-4 2]|uniref:hypothetical protein n=1 Tax=Caballeronia sp. SEWSISQ10-4 2 TaxID=2937438 RepID=UPI00264CDDC4|nr:hypothetical protein [Caballeronia sp. SEWSISQ10-4 2]MDN7179992.1 hypothetical protein [Caballeronia sp. SEWSISQ10-4 2]
MKTQKVRKLRKTGMTGMAATETSSLRAKDTQNGAGRRLLKIVRAISNSTVLRPMQRMCLRVCPA